MSNDTDFSIKLRGKITDVDASVKYMEVKKTRWDYYKRTYMENPVAVLKKELSEESAGAVVCWGIDFDSVKYHKDGRLATVKGASWANENGFGNVWILGRKVNWPPWPKKFPTGKSKPNSRTNTATDTVSRTISQRYTPATASGLRNRPKVVNGSDGQGLYDYFPCPLRCYQNDVY